jgi:folate-binding protein YgfZ
MHSDAPPEAGHLTHLGVLRFTGPDSASFLQGQLSNDTRRLEQGHGLLAAYSSPQGRVLAIMHLLPHSSGIVAILPRELVTPTLESLRRFVLRAKLKIEDASAALWVAGHYETRRVESLGIGPPTGSAYAEGQGVGVAAVNHGSGRYWAIGGAEILAQHGLAGERSQSGAIERDWRLADIRSGLPQIYLATRETFVAQMLNLDLLEGISFSKGCYTGQEIIARTQHLGRIKRRLYRLQLPHGDWSIGQPLQLTDGRAGRLVDAVRMGDGFEGLAVLNLPANANAAAASSGSVVASSGVDAAEFDPGADRIAAVELPLPYDLDRSQSTSFSVK